MTILEKSRLMKKNDDKSDEKTIDSSSSSSSSENNTTKTDSSSQLSAVENQFKEYVERLNPNFNVDTGENASDVMIEVLANKDVIVSLAVLLSYIRHCLNTGIKKDITVKIGYNKPSKIPMNFAINEELIEDIYPGDVVEIN